MKQKVILIDDERDARLLLRQYIEPFEDFEIIKECANGKDAVSSINELEPDLIFLDIKMPGLDGFQVVQQITHLPQIVFTTAYDQYALKAFESNAIDYLLKPYTAERFNKAVVKLSMFNSGNQEKIYRFVNDNNGNKYYATILVENGNKYVNIATKDILYIEADKDYSWIHTGVKSYLSTNGIGLLEQRMNPASFFRIHRSYIINIEQVRELHKDGSTAQVVMRNEKLLNVSRTYMEDLKKLLY